MIVRSDDVHKAWRLSKILQGTVPSAMTVLIQEGSHGNYLECGGLDSRAVELDQD